MRAILTASAVFAVLLCSRSAVHADDQADAKAIIEKATKAIGGGDEISKVHAVAISIKGKFHRFGDGVDYTGTIEFQAPDKQRVEIAMEVMNMKFTFKQIVNKDKGWKALNDDVTELDKEAIEELLEQRFANGVAQLNPAVLKDAKLAPLGEITIDKKKAVGVRVESKGHRDVALFFDKETHLLLKSETRGKDIDAGGGEYAEEKFYSDYKQVGKLNIPHKVKFLRDGKPFLDSETTDYKVVDKIDDGQFKKP